jgi:ribosomal protein S18 acetylase RimI-like enzyme
VLGFANDPLVRWCWPTANAYMEAMPRFIIASGGKAFDSESAYTVDGYRGAALWLPPGVEADEGALEQLVVDTVAADKQAELGAAFKELDGYHPDVPHWYLPLIAVDSCYQGQGIGALLMKHAVQRCDEDGVKAYLESSNPANISLYQRHGFEVVGEVQIGSVPVLTPMIRVPR